MNDSDLLSPAERALMLSDIAHVALAAAGTLYPGREWNDLDIARGTLARQKSPVERLGFIVHALPGLARDMEYIAHNPIVCASCETRPISPPVRARRVSAAALLQAVRGGHAGEWVTETRPTVTPDTPENRAIYAFLDTLRRDADAIAAIADAAGETETAGLAHNTAAHLRRLCAHPFWERVTSDPHAGARPATARMLSHPTYARVATQIRAYRAAFAFDWQHPLFSLPARDDWALYETWALLQILRALLAIGYVPVLGTDAPFAVRQERLTLRLMTGQSSQVRLRLPGGTALSLYYNPEYPAGQRSLSRTMQPDFALVTAGDKTCILDAKLKAYALPGDEGDDMNQMHAYRDAILDGEGNRAVRRAWCLFAGLPGETSRETITYGAIGDSIVGAAHLRPGDAGGFAQLCALLRGWLR